MEYFKVVLGIFTINFISCSLSSPVQIVCVPAQNNYTSFCPSLQEALQSVESNSFLQLEPGRHILHNDSIISDKTNVSLIGNSANASSVVIECHDPHGVIFMNIKQLTLSGFTVTDCGFTGRKHVSDVFLAINDVVRFFYRQLYFFSTGVLLFDIHGLTMENAVIKGNEGFGMVGINIIGKSRFSNVNFISNFPGSQSVCNFHVTNAAGGSGGGLFLLYQDYIESVRNEQAYNTSLTFEGGLIQHNYNCRRDPFITQYNRLSKSLATSILSNVSIVGSGGITLSLGQTLFSFSGLFDNCNFTNNSGLYFNSGLQIMIYNDTEKSEVTVQNSRFERNGGLFYKDNDTLDFPENGLDPFGALGVLHFIPLPINLSNPDSPQPLPEPARVTIENCSFVGNTALSGAGVSFFSFTTTSGFINDMLIIRNCDFHENTGNFGSAIFITELSYSAFESALTIIVDSIDVYNNIPLQSNSGTQALVSDTLSVLEISYVQVNFIGTNRFRQNLMTAISASNAVLQFSGNSRFTGNTGVTGGALHLERESYLLLVNQTELMFDNNHGEIAGGAIYVQFSTIRASTYNCYLFFKKIEPFCDATESCELPNNNYLIKFINNTSPLGSAVFGSNLDNCPWNNDSVLALNATFLPNFTDANSSTLPVVYNPPLFTDRTTVNTFPLIITQLPDTENNNTRVTDSEVDRELEPGQQFSIPLSAYDALNQPVPLTIFSHINDTQAYSTIGVSDRLLLAGGEEEFTSVPIRINGPQNSSYTVVISSNEVPLETSFTLSVTLRSCSEGFMYNNATRSCECEIDKHLDQVTCNPNEGSISFPENQWIGKYLDQTNYIQASCIRDFCTGNTTVHLSDPNTQCRNNRSGLLCGRCADSYSRVTGTSSCERCENHYLALIALFMALGILLVVILAVFSITITDGLINGFIFYANIFSVYTSTFIPVYDQVGPGKLSGIIIISFLNLHFGIRSCFYNGMTELGLVGLTLIFPIYLMLILLVIVLIGKYIHYNTVSHFFQHINVTHIFATLLFTSYASVMETCVAILAGLPVNVNQIMHIHWGRDPNIVYGTGIHGFLVVVSVLLLVVIIPIPIILLIPSISFRVRFLRRFKPVIDAFLAPFAPKKSFWISFRLMFRVLIYLVAAFGVSSEQLVVMSVLITSLTLLQAYLKPFNSSGRNIVDTFLMFNLTLFANVAIFLFGLPPSRESEVISAMFAFIYIFNTYFLILSAHYLLKRFKYTKELYKNIISGSKRTLKKMGNYFQKTCCNSSGSAKGEKANDITHENMFHNAVTHTSVMVTLREALLEENEQTVSLPNSQKRKISNE